jgi:hypothetical protein
MDRRKSVPIVLQGFIYTFGLTLSQRIFNRIRPLTN